MYRPSPSVRVEFSPRRGGGSSPLGPVDPAIASDQVIVTAAPATGLPPSFSITRPESVNGSLALLSSAVWCEGHEAEIRLADADKTGQQQTGHAEYQSCTRSQQPAHG